MPAAADFSARVKCRSLIRSLPSGFVPRSLFQLTVTLLRAAHSKCCSSIPACTRCGCTAWRTRNVTLYHNVTLGGVSWEKVKRHPTLEDHVVVGAGAQVLGLITIGSHSRIGANSVVVKDVPPKSVVVGIPGRVRSRNGESVIEAEHEDLQHNRLPDPTSETLRHLTARVLSLEHSYHQLHLEDDRQTADVWVESGGSHI